MNFLRLLLPYCCTVASLLVSGTNVSAQSPATDSLRIEERITTFDQLTKTIIAFTAPVGEPHISVTPLPRNPYSLNAVGKGKYELVFEGRVAPNTYKVLISSGSESKTAMWRVLPTILDAQSMNSVVFRQWYYGTQLALNVKLPEAASNLPREQFSIEYKLGNAPRMTDIPFLESWKGPMIPASATTCHVAVIWRYPPTGARLPLLHYTFFPKQTPAELRFENTRALLLGDSALKALQRLGEWKPDDCEDSINVRNAVQASAMQEVLLGVEGLSVDTTQIPIDTDERDPNSSMTYFASTRDIELVKTPFIDFMADNTTLAIFGGEFGGDRTESEVAWRLSAQTLRVVESHYNPETGRISLILGVLVPKIPFPETRALKGTLMCRIALRTFNRKAGVSSENTQNICPIQVNTSYNRFSNVPLPANRRVIVGEAIKPAPIRIVAPAEDMCKDCQGFSATHHVWRVQSRMMRNAVQAAMRFLGRKVPKKSFATTLPLVVAGRLKMNKKYEVFALRFGNEVMTAREIKKELPDSLQRVLSAPIVAITDAEQDSVIGYGKQYEYTVLSESEQKIEQQKLLNLAYTQGRYNKPENLGSLQFYKYSGFALYEADERVVTRFRETFTPPLPRTQGLELAEQACTTAERIKAIAQQHRPVPQRLIDEGGSPQDCEVVKNYYTQSASLVRIQKTFLLVDHRTTPPSIVGTIPTSIPFQPQIMTTEDWANTLAASLRSGQMSGESLRNFCTQEWEEDEISKRPRAVKGSFETGQFATLYEYCLAQIQAGKFLDRTQALMAYPAVRSAALRK